MIGPRFLVVPLLAAIAAGAAIRALSPGANLLFSFGGALIAGLVAFAALLGLGLRGARREDAQRARELEALAQIELVLAGSPEPAEALTRALDLILEFSHAGAAQLWVKSAPSAPLTAFLHRGLFPESFLPPDTVPEHFALADVMDSHPAMLAKGFVELVQIPLSAHGHTVGVLEIAARHRDELQTITPGWFETVGRSLAATLADLQELTRVRTQLADERRLWQAGLDVTATENYDELLRTIVDRARELIGAEASALCLWDAEKRWWVVQGTSGATDAFQVSLSQFERGDGQRVECPVIRFKYRRAHLDLPLQHNGQIVGCLCVANGQAREYSADERALLTGIANQATLAVERTRLLEATGSRAATTERERLAREIHDTLAQILGFVNIKTGAARELLAQGQVEQAKTQLDQLALLSQELYQDTRELILGLHRDAGTERGLVPALQSYVERFSAFCSLPASFSGQEVAVNFSPAVEVQLIRVVQEALSNVRKHAHARHAWVSMTREQDQIVLEIRDDGQGFDPSKPGRGFGPRFGLQSMRERVESIHGTFAVYSTAGEGTTVRIQVPLIYRGEDL